MEATIEAPTMTLKEAEVQINTWNQSLQAAQQALSAHERQMGQLALSGNAQAAAQELHRLEVDVKVAQQALEAAQSQRETVRHGELRARAKQLREKAAELDKLAEEHAAIYNELAAKTESAKKNMWDYDREYRAALRNAEDIESKLRLEGLNL